MGFDDGVHLSHLQYSLIFSWIVSIDGVSILISILCSTMESVAAKCGWPTPPARALVAAVLANNKVRVRSLLDGADVNEWDEYQTAPLHIAASHDLTA